MRYKRQEGFRYQFDLPLECKIRVPNVEHSSSYTIKGTICDLSPNGMKISVNQEVPAKSIIISFVLMDFHVVRGEIIWENKSFSGKRFMGVMLDIEKEEQVQLVNELKVFVKKVLRASEAEKG